MGALAKLTLSLSTDAEVGDLNPQAHLRFRPSLNLAGFEIIDCPALTSEGKTSTDINMVLDIVDLLQYETRYNEFIVFSADADFTPVLRKLRRWDRRTTVLAISFPSAAYRASADLLIDQKDFVRNALSFDETAVPPPVEPQPAGPSAAEFGPLALQLILQAVCEAATPVSQAKIAFLLLSRIEGLDASSWAGFGSFRTLIEALDLSPLVVSWESGGTIHDPRRNALAASQSHGNSNGKAGKLVDTVVDTIRNEVARAGQVYPVAGWPRCRSLLMAAWRQTGLARAPSASLSNRPRPSPSSSTGAARAGWPTVLRCQP